MSAKPLRGSPEYADKLRPDLDISIHDIDGDSGYIISRSMKCDFPSRNIVKDVAILVAEYLDLREAYREPGHTKRKNEAAKLPLQPAKCNRWIGNTICEATAMEPRNQRSGYLGWDL
jgi:hypothetical protein